MATDRILITGANRGIGLELVRQYIGQADAQVFAACRTPRNADDLNALANANPTRLHVLALDVTDAASIDGAMAYVQTHTDGLDVLINNAGIFPEADRHARMGALKADTLRQTLETNTIGPLMVTQAAHSLLKAGSNPRVIMISSQLGSIERARSVHSYAYRTSKAAVNMLARVLSVDLQSDGITVITLHPGWVQTDMGGSNATLTPEASAQGIVQVIKGLTPSDSGTFLQWDGERLPW